MQEEKTKSSPDVLIIGNGSTGLALDAIKRLKEDNNVVLIVDEKITQKNNPLQEAFFDAYKELEPIIYENQYKPYERRQQTKTIFEKLNMTPMQLHSEYLLILEKKSKLSRTKRDMIVDFVNKVIKNK